MLEDIEKAFDTAFFYADHNLKLVNQVMLSFDDVVLSDDLSTHLNQSITNINNQLSTMAFCFAQLMCKTILVSENYFILKEKLKQLQIENFHFKSDKAFMDFVRKLNMICSNCKQTIPVNKSEKSDPVQTPTKSLSPSFTNNHHVRNNQNSKEKQCSNSVNLKNRNNKINKDTAKRGKFGQANKTKTYSASKSNIMDETGDKSCGFEKNFLNNCNSKHLVRNSAFRMHRYNNDAFRFIYRNFKEVEFINHLNTTNITLQKENFVLKSELSNYRIVVKYLNNQLSGRIQQIQLLSRDKKDSNFEQVWNDLESEILLNKFKTIIHALNSNQKLKDTSFFNLFHSVQNSPLSIKLNRSEIVIQQNCVDSSTASSSSSSYNSLNRSSKEIDISNSVNPSVLPQCKSLDEEILMRNNLKNFKRSWFNIGLLRFVFVTLADEAIGISIIGGKEFNLPVMISEIHDGTPAHQTGAFKPGDIILTVNFVDITDMTHDDAVNLLQNLSGNCRFGVIYFQPDGQNCYESLSSTGSQCSATGVSLLDIPQLCTDYYRSVFNTSIVLPFHCQSDWSTNSSSSSSTPSDSELSSSSRVSSSPQSDCSESGHHFGNSLEDNYVTLVDSSPLSAIQSYSELGQNNISTSLVSNYRSPYPSIVNSKKAFPGTAERLSKPVS